MKLHLACVLAAAAVLSLAACGGGGGSGSLPAPDLDDIRELTGLTAPAETGPAQRARQRDIFAHADSLVVSTMHTEKVFPDETRTITLLTACSGAACELLNPATGLTVTTGLDTIEIVPGDAEAIGSAHGITLTSETSHHDGTDLISFGAWMDHSAFDLVNQRRADEESESDLLHTLALGELPGRALTGSATWLGIMVGTPIAGGDRGDRLVGTAALNYDIAAGGLNAGFSGIRNIDRGTAHSVEAVIFSDLAVGSDGTFARGQSGARIQGGFYGARHAEAAGIFEHSGMIAAFGAKRQ